MTGPRRSKRNRKPKFEFDASLLAQQDLSEEWEEQHWSDVPPDLEASTPKTKPKKKKRRKTKKRVKTEIKRERKSAAIRSLDNLHSECRELQEEAHSEGTKQWMRSLAKKYKKSNAGPRPVCNAGMNPCGKCESLAANGNGITRPSLALSSTL